jgi:Zn-finger nucleic acid-binding protein
MKDPDLTYQKCSSCGGIFLEKGELNAFATGMKGDIEFSSIDESIIKEPDKFPQRSCPKCTGQKMDKINLLAYSDLIFDYCPNCESFFLDQGEAEAMNDELIQITPRGAAQEFRGYKDEYLVRIDRRQDVQVGGYGLAGMRTVPMQATTIFIAVYFNKPVARMRVYQETWAVQLAKTLGLFNAKDIQTGNAEFDKLFRVLGNDETAIVRLFDNEVTNALVDFASRGYKLFTLKGKIEISDKCIAYKEGRYKPDTLPDLVAKSEPVVKELISIAKIIESK